MSPGIVRPPRYSRFSQLYAAAVPQARRLAWTLAAPLARSLMTRDLTGSSMCSCGIHCQASIGACPVPARTYDRWTVLIPFATLPAPHVLPFHSGLADLFRPGHAELADMYSKPVCALDIARRTDSAIRNPASQRC